MLGCFDDFVTLPTNAIPAFIFTVLNQLSRPIFPKFYMVHYIAVPWMSHAVVEHFRHPIDIILLWSNSKMFFQLALVRRASTFQSLVETYSSVVTGSYLDSFGGPTYT